MDIVALVFEHLDLLVIINVAKVFSHYTTKHIECALNAIGVFHTLCALTVKPNLMWIHSNHMWRWFEVDLMRIGGYTLTHSHRQQ